MKVSLGCALMLTLAACDREPKEMTAGHPYRPVPLGSACDAGRCEEKVVRTEGPNLIWRGTPNHSERGYAEKPPLRGSAPFIVDSNADGQDEIIGLVETPDKAGRVFVASFEASTVAVRWLSEPIDDANVKIEHLLVHAVGARVVATTGLREIKLMDASDGRVVTMGKLEGLATAICDAGKGRVLVDDTKGAHFAVDTVAGTVALSNESCETQSYPVNILSPNPRIGSYPAEWGSARIEVDDDTSQPSVVARDKQDKVLFSRLIDPDQLVHEPAAPEFFYAGATEILIDYLGGKAGSERGSIESSGQRFMVSIDAKSGAVRWRFAYPKKEGPALDLAHLAVSADHVFMGRAFHLDVVDRRRGGVVGWVGWH